jgi:hypothetical protein
MRPFTCSTGQVPGQPSTATSLPAFERTVHTVSTVREDGLSGSGTMFPLTDCLIAPTPCRSGVTPVTSEVQLILMSVSLPSEGKRTEAPSARSLEMLGNFPSAVRRSMIEGSSPSTPTTRSDRVPGSVTTGGGVAAPPFHLSAPTMAAAARTHSVAAMRILSSFMRMPPTIGCWHYPIYPSAFIRSRISSSTGDSIGSPLCPRFTISS